MCVNFSWMKQKLLILNISDGDLNSSKFYEDDQDRFVSRPSMYNLPTAPVRATDPNSGVEIIKVDAKKRSTLISDETRVYKGGSWVDREYWLDPAQRRYLPQYMATNFIGFRCVTDMLGPMDYRKKTNASRSR